MCILRCRSVYFFVNEFHFHQQQEQRSDLSPVFSQFPIFITVAITHAFSILFLYYFFITNTRVVSCSQLMVIMMMTMKKWGDRNKAICVTGSNPDLPFFSSLCIISKIGVSNKDVQLFIWLYQLSVVAAVLLLLFLWSDINAMHEFCLFNSSAGYPFHRLFQSLSLSSPLLLFLV